MQVTSRLNQPAPRRSAPVLGRCNVRMAGGVRTGQAARQHPIAAPGDGRTPVRSIAPAPEARLDGSPRREPWVSAQNISSPGRGERISLIGNFSVAPTGAYQTVRLPHGSRRGLPSVRCSAAPWPGARGVHAASTPLGQCRLKRAKARAPRCTVGNRQSPI
ncbi:MAG: hypothetical protein RL380_1761 [Verrucomicrobiota bacterium]